MDPWLQRREPSVPTIEQAYEVVPHRRAIIVENGTDNVCGRH